ncbi:hypothetical protein CBOM_01244 [Ceraceosorus bombacis]|uniref:Uncharacterized protein n=2 Tax=Ceraceosorus bombacis TaxID=401625 RepID=A0A0P1BCR5_9BASI|nr:hypothetical protein CBOM_01244 [Ceraceosorus bombacis]
MTLPDMEYYDWLRLDFLFSKGTTLLVPGIVLIHGALIVVMPKACIPLKMHWQDGILANIYSPIAVLIHSSIEVLIHPSIEGLIHCQFLCEVAFSVVMHFYIRESLNSLFKTWEGVVLAELETALEIFISSSHSSFIEVVVFIILIWDAILTKKAREQASAAWEKIEGLSAKGSIVVRLCADDPDLALDIFHRSLQHRLADLKKVQATDSDLSKLNAQIQMTSQQISAKCRLANRYLDEEKVELARAEKDGIEELQRSHERDIARSKTMMEAETADLDSVSLLLQHFEIIRRHWRRSGGAYLLSTRR